MAGDPSENLRPEDRKFDLSFRKTHQATAWAINATATLSFFNRSTILWLQQLQSRLPSSKVWLHQDLNKILAVTQLSSDATLNAAKYSSRALASSITSRRLLWLKSWPEFSGQLFAAPYMGTKLFGEALDLLLVEDKERKVLPSAARRVDRRATPYFWRQPFLFNPHEGSFQQQSYPQGQFCQQDKQPFRYRGRQIRSQRRSFHRAGGCQFHKQK